MTHSFNEFWEKAAEKGSAAEAGKEIPQDIWEAAEKIAYEYEDGDKLAGRLKSLIALGLMAERHRFQWKPISTAPDFERIMISGWKRPSGGCAGYWWWEEGMAEKGKDMLMKDATHWCPIIVPDFPAPPITSAPKTTFHVQV